MDIDETLRNGFRQAPFIAHLGIELENLGAGFCEASLALHLAPATDAGVHAGVIARWRITARGSASLTCSGEFVVTAEIQDQSVGAGPVAKLRCRAKC